jgi:hypothetical protein
MALGLNERHFYENGHFAKKKGALPSNAPRVDGLASPGKLELEPYAQLNLQWRTRRIRQQQIAG